MSENFTSSEIEKLKKAFNFFDTDGNGYLSRDEIANLLRSLGTEPTDQNVESIFVSMDENSSNGIDFNSFVRWMADKE